MTTFTYRSSSSLFYNNTTSQCIYKYAIAQKTATVFVQCVYERTIVMYSVQAYM